MLLRSLNLRRLSYVLLSGEKNHYLTQLPSIQEKLVDTLRNVSAPVVQCEVYLCVRVLLCRLSPHNLSSFWPVILTELVRPASPRRRPSLTRLTFRSTASLIKSSRVFPPMARKSLLWCLRHASCLTSCSFCRRRNSKCKYFSSPEPHVRLVTRGSAATSGSSSQTQSTQYTAQRTGSRKRCWTD